MSTHPILGFHEGPLDLTDPAHYEAASSVDPGAHMLPRWAYRSKAFADLEDEKVWTRHWVCVGFSGAIPNPGDLLPYTVGDHGIHVRRDADGSLRGYFNFAQHGGCRFVPRQCQTGRKTNCFYTSCGHSRDRDVLHALADGSDTPEMYMYRGINPLKLLPIHVAVAGPLVFVNLDLTPPELAAQYGDGLTILCERLGTATALPEGWQTDVKANWKARFRCGLATRSESDDVDPSRAATPADGHGFWARTERNSASGQRVPSFGVEALRALGTIGSTVVAGVFPNLLLHSSDRTIGMTLLKPVGLTETTQTSRVLVQAGADANNALEWWRTTTSISQQAAEDLQATLAGSTNPSPFLPQHIDDRPAPIESEPLAGAFQRYLLAQLLRAHASVDRPLYSNPGRALNAGVNSGAF